MNVTPNVNFNIINNNVEESVPLLGISTVLARTTKGTPNNPGLLVQSISQFKSEYGEEIVKDGSVSNIEKALLGGSKLRIIRVINKETAKKGGVSNSLENLNDEVAKPILRLFCRTSSDVREYELYLTTKGYGDPIGDIYQDKYYITTEITDNRVYFDLTEDPEGNERIESDVLFSYFTENDDDEGYFLNIDYLSFNNWIKSNKYFDISFVKVVGDVRQEVDLTEVLSWLSDLDNTKVREFEVSGTKNDVATFEEYNGTAIGSIGSPGGTPTYNDWLESCEYIRDYVDSYNILASGLFSDVNPGNALSILKHLKEILDEINEFRLFIEIPKNLDNLSDIIQWKNSTQLAIGYSKWISYYAGGLMYSNQYGIIKPSDVGGTVLGLADTSATNYGYDKSFSGLNRGVVPDALGPVCPNYGSPGRVSYLNELAEENINIFVIKDTPNFGKRTVLWHGFTDQFKNDSFRFLGNTGLILNIKKTLRPILESYLEEPNIWTTWHRIYLRVLPIINNWVDSNAITDPVWRGDQDASSWEDLVVNNEADVRQGKYHIIFSFKDIVALQVINIDLVIEQASRDITIEL